MDKLSRRQLIQKSSLLLMGSAVSPAVLAQTAANSSGEPTTIYIPPGGGKKGKIANADIVFKFDSEQTSGHFGSSEITIAPGQLGAPPHYHKSFDEVCIVLEGTVHIMVEEEVYEVPKGGWHLRPRGKVHTFWNAGKEKASVIELCLPGGHEAYMKELAVFFENNARPNPGDLQKLAAKYDIIFRWDKLDAIVKKYGVSL